MVLQPGLFVSSRVFQLELPHIVGLGFGILASADTIRAPAEAKQVWSLTWRVAQRRNNYDFGENEIFISNRPGDKGASFLNNKIFKKSLN